MYVSSKKLPDACWAYDDSLVVKVPIAAETAGVRVQLTFEEEYAYSNIYLSLTLLGPSGKKTTLQATETFIDPLGNWQVPADGSSYPYIFSGFASIPNLEVGEYTLVLAQAMRDNPLCHIKKVSNGVK